MSKYYGKKSIGNNANIQRHREDEARLRAMIERCDAEAASGDRLSKMEAEAYRNILRGLQESKAEMASNLFKKKA